MKRCCRCGKDKPLGEFYREKRAVDGLRYQCRACDKARDAAYYAANREKHLAASAANYAANREKYKAASIAWNAANPKKIKAQNAAHYAAYCRRLRILLADYQTPCVNCGATVDLCWHHVNPNTKTFQLSTISARTDDEILAEVTKCVVLCRSCHTKHHKPARIAKKVL
ncbi:MAG: hypothetical protein JRC93_04090 [Deltaproteobacteria bacterium]|nr:hypothetical protein [Deltaproteobacteria bacterium]